MVELTIRIPEGLLEKLRRQADRYNEKVEEFIQKRLKIIPETEEQKTLSEKDRMERFIRKSGLFADPENKLGPELRKLAQPVSEGERAWLVKVLSKGKPLSKMIIEDRGA